MNTRRRFLKMSAHLTGGLIMSRYSLALGQGYRAKGLYMPEEGELHERTWMAFVANDYVWSKRQIPQVKQNLALIANTIAQYEPVSMLVSPYDVTEAKELLNKLGPTKYNVDLVEFEVDDLWLRDTGPTFVLNEYNEKVAIDFNFNGWGNKQEHGLDRKVARFIAEQAKAAVQSTHLTLEGGCFEVDGHGTAILTKSCVINDNRNPGLSQGEIEEELKSLLGLEKIIWLEGVKGRDITDGHTDFYARFIRPGEVMVSRDNYRPSYDYEVTRQNIRTLEQSTDASGNPLKLHIIDTPNKINERFGVSDFAAGYIGYYVCNGAVIAQKFGDKKADAQARSILQKAFPDRVIEQIAIDAIASGGGSIHCATQQEIKIS